MWHPSILSVLGVFVLGLKSVPYPYVPLLTCESPLSLTAHVLGHNTKLGLYYFIVGSIMKICTIYHCILKLNCLDT